MATRSRTNQTRTGKQMTLVPAAIGHSNTRADDCNQMHRESRSIYLVIRLLDRKLVVAFMPLLVHLAQNDKLRRAAGRAGIAGAGQEEVKTSC
ncbi:hypothetical protein G7K_0602-t1 [Saitoella complicata NRRL Y-17804]|uniref:Uncharacterized protein n=1 Tax=Saitoella complicata (strain BCRC 22490 / CBS 7301 / JCM 7358 / NBRC 10748 / NRRL Y-17804) TaxID=698492 RepID=A0A0E9N9J6_SAICN|nr:hypothetical protein G7K_0602-t1 [Saitoella complicata NRRL Y-17804]